MIENRQINMRPLVTQVVNPKDCNKVYRELKLNNSNIATLFKWK